jgi:hypothetical protein
MGVTEFAYSLKWFFSKLLKRPAGELKNLFEKKTVRIAIVVSIALIAVVPLI